MINLLEIGAAPSELHLAYLDPVSFFSALHLLAASGAVTIFSLRSRMRYWLFGQQQLVGWAARLFDPPHPSGLTMADGTRRIVVLIEGARDLPYINPVVQKLLAQHVPVYMICGPAAGPQLSVDTNIKLILCRNNIEWLRLSASLVDCECFTTINGLGESWFPKSVGCTYHYIFHSLCSTTITYKPGSFLNYDHLHVPSAHHLLELRDSPNAVSDGAALHESGYPMLDNESASEGVAHPAAVRETVLIAPSWGSDDRYWSLWPELTRKLAAMNYRVVLRPHPESIKRSGPAILFARSVLFATRFARLELAASRGEAAVDPAVLVSDWSGIALEMAMVGVPVVHVDTPRRRRSDLDHPFSHPPLEEFVRETYGRRLGENVAEIAAAVVASERSTSDPWMELALYNPGRASDVIAKTILDIARPIRA